MFAATIAAVAVAPHVCTYVYDTMCRFHCGHGE